MAKRNKYDVDEELDRHLDFSRLKRAIVYVKPYKFLMLLALLLSALAAVMGLLSPKFLQTAIDEAMPNGDTGLLVKLAIFTLVTIIISAVLSGVRGFIMSKIGQNIIFSIRKDLFEHLQKLPFSYYDSRPHGKILVRVVNYVNNVSNTLTNGIINAIIDILNIVFIAFFMFWLDAKLALLVLLGLPVLLTFVFLVKNLQRKVHLISNNKNSNLTAYTCENINGVKVVEIFNRQEENFRIYENLNKDYRTAWYKMAFMSVTTSIVSENLKRLVVSLVYVGGVLWVSPESIKIGVLLAMGTYASRFWDPIISLANIYNDFLTSASYLERIFQTMDEPIDIADGENSKPLENMKGEIEFKNVNFEYEKDIRILKNISFKANAGESIALVGPTGSGKSTIVNLISRFYNVSSGELLIDGVNINDITISSLRTQMGIMLQDSFIFSGTIADNIRYGKLDATIEEVKAACKAVCADEFIENFPDGYDTVVNERGGMLSQGQKQLIAFARTMLRNPAVLILDEATSSIDANTEKQLQIGIESLLKGRTSFIIAHRLSTIKNCNKIMFIQSGEIIECGTHDELMAKKGAYYKLCMAQDQ
ncbi:MAG: ABC transporter ATP-binding protein [Clostridia bacterium]|nr:ABC transporter ATP-binding protein [Clostridia bacterium]